MKEVPIRLPEIRDTIIDRLHNDKMSLRACTLVCQSWTRRATYHLFADITILTHRLERFVEFFAPEPQSHRSLRSENACQDTRTLRLRENELPLDFTLFYRALYFMPNLLQVVMNVNKFSLHAPIVILYRPATHHLNLERLEIRYETHLRSLRGTATLLVNLLFSFKCLKSLVIEARTPRAPSSQAYEHSLANECRIIDLPILEDSLLSLKHLDIRNGYAPFKEALLFSRIMRPGTLKFLHIGYRSRDDIEAAGKLIKAAAQRLQHITLRPSCERSMRECTY